MYEYSNIMDLKKRVENGLFDAPLYEKNPRNGIRFLLDRSSTKAAKTANEILHRVLGTDAFYVCFYGAIGISKNDYSRYFIKKAGFEEPKVCCMDYFGSTPLTPAYPHYNISFVFIPSDSALFTWSVFVRILFTAKRPSKMFF